jgi:hypothetical protein
LQPEGTNPSSFARFRTHSFESLRVPRRGGQALTGPSRPSAMRHQVSGKIHGRRRGSDNNPTHFLIAVMANHQRTKRPLRIADSFPKRASWAHRHQFGGCDPQCNNGGAIWAQFTGASKPQIILAVLSMSSAGTRLLAIVGRSPEIGRRYPACKSRNRSPPSGCGVDSQSRAD